MSSHCICSFHFYIYSYPVMLASHRWTCCGVAVYPFICIYSQKTSIIDLFVCSFNLHKLYCVPDLIFFFFYSMHCFLKFGPSCVLVYLHFIALSTSAVFASLFSQFWGSEFSLILLGWQKLRNWTFPSDRDTESSCATCRRLGVHTLESSAWVYVCARACIR